MRKPLSIWLVLSLLLGSCHSTSAYSKYQAEFMGVFDTFTIMVGYAQSEEEFDRCAEAMYTRLEELHRLYDIYNEYEGLNNLYTINQQAGIAPVEVQQEIIGLLLFAREGYTRTKGMVNGTMGSVLSLWHDYREMGLSNPDRAELPPSERLREAAGLTNPDDLVIDEENSTVFLKRHGMSLDVGAIAKGYAVGLAVEAARDIDALLLNVGGNITAIGKPMDAVRARWGIGIQSPESDAEQTIADTVYFNDATVSCSGDYQRYYIVDGKRYHHIIDPLTLMPANRYKQVAVIHPEAELADLLSTALFILPQEDGAALAKETGAEVLWIYRDGSQKATEGYGKISKNIGNYSAVDG